MARRFIALELETEALHLAVASHGEQGTQLAEVRTLPYASDEELGELLCTLQDELQPGITDVAELLLPAGAGYARVLEYPFKSRRKLAGVVPPDFFYRLPVESEQLVLDTLSLAESGDHSRVAVAALPREELRRVSDLFKQADFPLGRAGMLPWGLADRDDSRGERQLLAWLRDDEIGLALYDGEAIRRYALQGRTPGDSDERVTWILRQAEILERADGWEGLPLMLYGGDSELREALVAAGREVQEDPFERSATSVSSGQQRVAQLAVAGLKSRHSRQHNFLQGEFAPSSGWQGLRQMLRFSLGLALGVLVLGVVTLWSGYLRKAHEVTSLEAQSEQLLRATFPEIRTIQDKRRQMEGELRQLRSRAGAHGAAHATPLELLRAMSQQLPAGLNVVLNEWTLASGEVRLEGSTASFEDVERLAEIYAQLPGVAQAAVAESKIGSDKRVVFRMRLSLGEKP